METAVDRPMRFRNCEFDEYYSPVVVYEEPVELDGCAFHAMTIDAAYFVKGLVCRDCEVLSEVSYTAGGHNGPEWPILFERVRFHKFVDFFDCWFRGPVILRDVEFLAGTNLLNKQKGWVSFEIPPVLERVTGQLDLSLNLAVKDGRVVLDEIGPRGRSRDEAANKAKTKKPRHVFKPRGKRT